VVIKNTISWAITPWSPLKVNRRFGETYRLHFQGRIISRARNRSAFHLLSCCFLFAWLILRPWKWRRHVPPKHRLTFNGLHGVISQKTVLFASTLVTKLYNLPYQRRLILIRVRFLSIFMFMMWTAKILWNGIFTGNFSVSNVSLCFANTNAKPMSIIFHCLSLMSWKN
jgi:hypothetical protein